MKGRTKIIRWLALVFGTLSLLLFLTALLAPRVINLNSIKEEIENEASRTVGGSVEYEKVELSLLPRPGAVIRQSRVNIPGLVEGTVESLRVHPKLLPLFLGRVRVAEVVVEKPDIEMNLPEIPGKGTKGEEEVTTSSLEENLAALFGSLSLKVPDVTLSVVGGKVSLIGEEGSLLTFEDLDASLLFPPEGFTVAITCRSNIWDRLSVKGSLAERDFSGRGEMELTRFKPHVLLPVLFPDAPAGIDKAEVNLRLAFDTEHLNILQGEVSGAIPFLTLRRKEKRAKVEGFQFEGSYQVDESGVSATLSGLSIDSPRLTLSGEFLQDILASQVSLNLEARDLDVGSARGTALALAGDIPTVHDIFDIIRGGNIPEITFQSQGKTPADLGILAHMRIEGRMEGSKIFIPGVGLDLTGARGDMVISGAILEGRNLGVKLGKARGKDGTLKMGLEGDGAPFHLEIAARADLADLAPLLKKLIGDDTFDREVSLLSNLSGTAGGTLVLGERLDSVQANVDVSELSLSATYERIPYPIEIEGGNFTYTPSAIGVEDLRGNVGKSSFSSLTGKVELKNPPTLSARSGKIRIILDEAHRWVSSFEETGGHDKYVKEITGTANLSISRLHGPLFKPLQWKFETVGDLTGIVIDTPLTPGRIEIRKGSFEADREHFLFTHLDTDFLDASLHISGKVETYLSGIEKVEANLKGTIGKHATGWLVKTANLPTKRTLRTPISFDNTRIVWNREGEITGRGGFTVTYGPHVSFHVHHNPEGLTIEELSITDDQSKADLSLELKKRNLEVAFSGELTKGTLDTLFLEDTFPIGWVKGNFLVRVVLDRPMESTADGYLEAENISVPWNMAIPLYFKRISLGTAKKRVDIKSATLMLGENHLYAKGKVDFRKEDVHFDLGISSKGIKWDEIRSLIQDDNLKEKEADEGVREEARVFPLSGSLKLKSEYFTYGNYTWKPLNADITLHGNNVNVKVTEADLCGISTPGVITVGPDGLSLEFQLETRDQQLQPALECLTDETREMTGTFDLSANFTAQSNGQDPIKSLDGKIELIARDGRIDRLDPIARIFAHLNITGIVKGELPDMKKEGFTYETMIINGELQEGKFMVEEGIIKSPVVNIAGRGYVDYGEKKVNVTVLVAPLQGVDSIVSRIPVIRQITGGTLISIPVGVSGHFDDIKVRTLSASAVGSSLFGILKRTVEAPVNIIEFLVPESGAENDEEQ